MINDILCIINDVTNGTFREEHISFLKNSFHLTEKELKLFLLLCQRKGKVVSHTDIINFVWPEREAAITQNNILQLIFRLRKKLLHKMQSVVIKTVTRQGYMLETLPAKDINFLSSYRKNSILNPKYYAVLILALVGIVIISFFITTST